MIYLLDGKDNRGLEVNAREGEELAEIAECILSEREKHAQFMVY